MNFAYHVFLILGENGEAKTPKTDDQPHSDKSFYENLPFHGLKQPPKEVISEYV